MSRPTEHSRQELASFLRKDLAAGVAAMFGAGDGSEGSEKCSATA
jgi:hypothetical protein